MEQHELHHQLLHPYKKKSIRWRFKREPAFKDGACLVTSWRSIPFFPRALARRCCDVRRTHAPHTVQRMITINNPGTRGTHLRNLSLEFFCKWTELWVKTITDSWGTAASISVEPPLALTQRIFEFWCQTRGRTWVTPFLSPSKLAAARSLLCTFC